MDTYEPVRRTKSEAKYSGSSAEDVDIMKMIVMGPLAIKRRPQILVRLNRY